MKLIHARISGWTATFRLPMFYTGTGITSPVPPYSTLLGLLGNMAGRVIHPEETRIGFAFQSDGTSYDLESLQRLQVDDKGRLKEKPERNVAMRQFLVKPQLDLYLDNIETLLPVLKNPVCTPLLGRSQDVAWIKAVNIIDAQLVEEGFVRDTLVPFPQEGAKGLILNLPDYFENDENGFTRTIGSMTCFQVVKGPAYIRRSNLYQVPESRQTIYLHRLAKSNGNTLG